MKTLDPVGRRRFWRAALYAAALLLSAAGAWVPPAARAQTPARPGAPAAPYEWVLISTEGFPASIRHDQSHMMTSNRPPLRQAIAFAYDVDVSRVFGGPDWIDQRLYYIVAGLPPAEARPLLRIEPGVTQSSVPSEASSEWDGWRARDRMLLADRFSLRAHRETRLVPGYILTVDSGGARVTAVPESSLAALHHRGVSVSAQNPPPSVCSQALTGSATVTDITVTAVTLHDVAQALAMWLGRPVVDHTGLHGYFDFDVTGTFTAATLIDAFRDQAGLAVEPGEATVDVVVVDGIERPTLDDLGPGTWHMREPARDCPNAKTP